MTIKLVDIKNASERHAQEMKVDRLYKDTPKQFLTLAWPHIEPWKKPKMTLNWADIKNAIVGNA